jgi:hypothetical protein
LDTVSIDRPIEVIEITTSPTALEAVHLFCQQTKELHITNLTNSNLKITDGDMPAVMRQKIRLFYFEIVPVMNDLYRTLWTVS